MGYKVDLSESRIDWLSHDLLREKQYDKAKILVEYHLENCPKTAAAHEYWIDYYQVTNDTKNALAYFEKSFANSRKWMTIPYLVRKETEILRGCSDFMMRNHSACFVPPIL